MIPRAHITAWRAIAPWPDNSQVEQDLILSRALVAMFSRAEVSSLAAFRGGTALHKLYLQQPGRYSEDIDLVQLKAGPIGTLVDSIRDALDPWLGPPSWQQGHGRFRLNYRFNTSFEPVVQMRVKIEINTREHFSVLGLREVEYVVHNPWFSGEAEITTYELPELLGTKLRALYQRKKGRDLFDLWLSLRSNATINLDQIVKCFTGYMLADGSSITRAQLELNLLNKLADEAFLGDLQPLLRSGIQYDPAIAFQMVQEQLLQRLPGEPPK